MVQAILRLLVVTLLVIGTPSILLFDFSVQYAYAQDDEDFEEVEEFEDEAAEESDDSDDEVADEGSDEDSGDEDDVADDDENLDDEEDFESDSDEEEVADEEVDEIDEIEDELDEFEEAADKKQNVAEEKAEEEAAEELADEAAEEGAEEEVAQEEPAEEKAAEEEGEEDQEVGFDEFEDGDEVPEEPQEIAEDEPVEEAPELVEGEQQEETLQAEEEEEPQQQQQEELSAGEDSGSFAYDSPNFEYEQALHDIFLKYHSKKTTPEEWSQIFGSREQENYTIQKGDSLWGISSTLFGDGQYWPKVWSLNGNITNPHLIKEDNIINFVLGNENEAPSFNVTEAGQEPPAAAPQEEAPAQDGEEAVEQQVTDANEGEESGVENYESEIEIPPPLKRSKPVVKVLPPSLPIWQLNNNEDGRYDEMGIDYEKRRIVDAKDQIWLSTYVVESPKSPLGKVLEVEDGNRVASEFQYIYVSLEDGVGEIGETFLVERNRGKIMKAHKKIKSVSGHAVDVQGEIQLVERVASTKDGNAFRAIVKRIVNPITTSGYLIKGNLKRVPVTDRGPKNQVVAEIIGGSFSNKRRVFNTESIAFINRGASDGVSVGDVMSVRANRQLRSGNSEIKTSVRPIGWLKVVDVTDNLATTVVAKSWSDIQAGDITGAGNLYSRKKKSLFDFDENIEGDLLNEFEDGQETSSNTFKDDNSDLESDEGNEFEDDIDDGF